MKLHQSAGLVPGTFCVVWKITDRRSINIMTEEKKVALAAIEARKDQICDVADRIWEYADS